jgi:hypothetical protein
VLVLVLECLVGPGYNIMTAGQNPEHTYETSHTFQIEHEDEHEHEVAETVPTP